MVYLVKHWILGCRYSIAFTFLVVNQELLHPKIEFWFLKRFIPGQAY